MAPLRSLGDRLLHDESGFGILEVMVSALLVAILSVGVLQGFDAANAASGNSRSRALAADVAQQDQERMRAFRAKELSNISQTPPYDRTVAGVKYHVVSTAVWVNDGSGSRRCGLTNGRADYLQITSTVTWDNMRGADPIVESSLYAPPSGSFGDQGNLGVEVLNRDALGVPGVSVTVSGPISRTGLTDAQGCIYFAFLPQGDYTTTISKSGYVNPAGAAVISSVYGVQGGTTQIQPVDYDQAGTIPVVVAARRGATATDLPAQANYLTFGHSQLPSPNTRIVGNGTSLSSFTVGGFFPFTSTYSVYSGNCPGAAPVAPPNVVVPRGGSSPTVTVREIAVRLRADGNWVSQASTTKPVKLYPVGSGCTINPTITLTTERAVQGDATTDGWIVAPTGALPRDPGVPYGIYDICVEVSNKDRAMLTNQNLTDPNGVTIDLGAKQKGSCAP